MSIRTTHMIFVLLVVLAAVALTACGGSPDGEALLDSRCNACHDLDRIISASKGRDEWETTVDRMITRGAVLDDAERETLIEYLADIYP